MLANDVVKTGYVTKNFNEKMQIYLLLEELKVFSTLLHLTVSNLIHAGIPLLLFMKKKKEDISWL